MDSFMEYTGMKMMKEKTEMEHKYMDTTDPKKQNTAEKDDTDAVLVRPYREADFDDLVRLTMHSLWFQSLRDESYTAIIRAAVHKEYVESDDEQFSVIRTMDDVYCGNISLIRGEDGTYEIGISLLDELQNRGIGTKALRQFCDYCFHERGIQSLLVRIEPENARSIHVFEKLGAVYRTKQALPILLRTYEALKKPVPNDLDETAGVLLYDLPLPLTAQVYPEGLICKFVRDRTNTEYRLCFCANRIVRYQIKEGKTPVPKVRIR